MSVSFLLRLMLYGVEKPSHFAYIFDGVLITFGILGEKEVGFVDS